MNPITEEKLAFWKNLIEEKSQRGLTLKKFCQGKDITPLGKAINYVLNNWNELTNYLKDGRLEIDNNKIENLIRPLALGCKNFLFMGSPQGAKAGAIYYYLIATCIENSVEPYKYFCSMLRQIRCCKTEEDYRKLLPQNIGLI